MSIKHAINKIDDDILYELILASFHALNDINTLMRVSEESEIPFDRLAALSSLAVDLVSGKKSPKITTNEELSGLEREISQACCLDAVPALSENFNECTDASANEEDNDIFDNVNSSLTK